MMLIPACERAVDAQWKRTTFPGSPTWNDWSPPANAVWLNGALYAAVDSSVYRSTNNGDSWQTLAQWRRDVKWEEQWQLAAHGSTLIATVVPRWNLGRRPPDWYAHLHVVRSTDGGLTWRDTTTLTGEAPLPTTVTTGRVIIPHGGIRNSVFHFTTDGGVSWDSTKSNGLSDVYPSHVIANGSLLFLTTSGSPLDNKLLKSADYGENWTPVATGFTGLPGSWYLNLMQVGNTLLAMIQVDNSGGGSTAIISADDGQTWSMAPVLDQGHWTNGKALFGNIAGGLGVIALNGASWKLWSEGLPATPGGSDPYVFNMTFSDSLAFVDIVAMGQSDSEQQLWRRPLSELVTGVDERTGDASPSVISLSQNYPNPFNPSTTITYKLPQSSVVRLSVFDMLGREVSTLVDERREAGVHEVRFDASGLSSGVYFYRLKAASYVETKTLLLVR